MKAHSSRMYISRHRSLVESLNRSLWDLLNFFVPQRILNHPGIKLVETGT